MKYVDSKTGRKYGIVPCRSLLETILINIPVIRCLYTKVVRVDIFSWNHLDIPAMGMFEEIRIFRKCRKFSVKFMVPDTFSNLVFFVTCDSSKYRKLFFMKKEPERILNPNTAYSYEFDLKDNN